MQATFDDFIKLDIRVGKIIDVQIFPKARKPSFKLIIDFGSEIDIRKSSGQLSEESYFNKYLILDSRY